MSFQDTSMSATSSQPSSNLFVLVVASIAAIAGILFGFDTGVISGAILFIQKVFNLTPFMNGVIVSAVLVGAMVGSVLSGSFADYFGRRKMLIVTALIFVIGTLGSAFAHTLTILYISRLCVGIAIGIASFTAPLYISEISPPNYRGALVSLNQLAITVGIMLAYIVDYSLAGSQLWRWMFGLGVIPAIILFFGMMFLPESPRWLFFRNHIDQARKTLQKIRGSNDVEMELQEIKSSLITHGDWKVFFQKWMWPAIFIAFGLGFFQQFGGINTIIYYAPTVFEMAGFHGAVGAILATAGIGLVNVSFTVVALFLIDHWGRRPLLIIGLIGMIIALSVMSLSFYFGAHAAFLKWFAFASMIVYIASFAISLGPVMWLVISEIFPLEIRGLGTSVATAFSWACNGVVSLTFLTLIQLFAASGAFLIYACISVLGLIFVCFAMPETKGTTLEQIEKNLHNGVRMRDLGQKTL